MYLARVLVLSVPVATSLYNVPAEDRLVPWIRENGGLVSESVGIAADNYGGRGFVALEDIKAGEKIFDIPVILHLDPTTQVEAGRFPKMIHDQMGREPSWAAHIAREVLRVTEEQPKVAKTLLGDGSKKGGFHDVFWASLESHMVLLSDDPVFWEPAEQEAIGKEIAYLLRAERHMHEARYDTIVKYMQGLPPHEKNGCPAQLAHLEGRRKSECDEMLGGITKKQYVRASCLHKSRTFNDNDLGVYVPYVELLNHRPSGLNNAAYALDEVSLDVTAERDIAKGEEISINYENSDNHHLLMHYGFTQPPAEEPSYYFYIPRGSPEGHPGAMTRGVVLSTPLFEHAQHGKEGPWWGVSKQVATLFHANTSSFREVVESFRDVFEADPAIQPFITQLRANIALSPNSRIWWRHEEEPETTDASGTEAMGSRRLSDAIRVKMCHYLCVRMYSEALTVHLDLHEDPEKACPIVKQLVKEIKTVHSYDYYAGSEL